MKPGRNVEWWTENVKQGDKIEAEVDTSDPNFWIFTNKKGNEVYFDEISYPAGELKKYFGPAPKFQRSKEDLGKKDSGYLIDLDNIKEVRTVNGEPVKKTKSHRTSAIKTNIPAGSEVPGKSTSSSNEIRQVNGRWVCPCYNPEFPDRFSYSQKGHAVWNHKKHIQS